MKQIIARDVISKLDITTLILFTKDDKYFPWNLEKKVIDHNKDSKIEIVICMYDSHSILSRNHKTEVFNKVLKFIS